MGGNKFLWTAVRYGAGIVFNAVVLLALYKTRGGGGGRGKYIK